VQYYTVIEVHYRKKKLAATIIICFWLSSSTPCH